MTSQLAAECVMAITGCETTISAPKHLLCGIHKSHHRQFGATNLSAQTSDRHDTFRRQAELVIVPVRTDL